MAILVIGGHRQHGQHGVITRIGPDQLRASNQQRAGTGSEQEDPDVGTGDQRQPGELMGQSDQCGEPGPAELGEQRLHSLFEVNPCVVHIEAGVPSQHRLEIHREPGQQQTADERQSGRAEKPCCSLSASHVRHLPTLEVVNCRVIHAPDAPVFAGLCAGRSISELAVALSAGLGGIAHGPARGHR